MELAAVILKKEFYFIRHGQTDYNLNPNEKNDTPYDTPLNEVGRRQAAAVEPLIAELPVKTICCSPLPRAQETKKIITPRLEVVQCDIADLSECNVQIWQTMTGLGSNAHLQGNETVSSFMRRVAKGVNEALQHPGPVLIIAHGGIHWALCCMLNLDQEWVIDNCIPAHFYLDDSGLWRVKKLT